MPTAVQSFAFSVTTTKTFRSTAAFSAAGDRVITAAGDTAILWSAADGEKLRPFKDINGTILAAH
jgi:hypothetical protein